MNITRTWSGQGRSTRCCVETRHPRHGALLRGWIRAVGVQDTTTPGLAGHLRWAITDPDHTDLGVHEGDYVDAERVLLDATSGLDAGTEDVR